MKKSKIVFFFIFFLVFYHAQENGQEKINNAQKNNIKTENNLQEIKIVGKPKKNLSKKENPAYRILQGIWENKERNDFGSLDFYEYRRYTAVDIGIDNMDSVLAQKILGNDFVVLQQFSKEKAQESDKLTLPVFLNELSERIYGRKNKERKDIEGERKSGLNEVGRGFGVERFSQVFTNVNPYEDDIKILDKTFVSPLSTRGYGVYNYVLKDSITEGVHKIYTIHFFPRNPGDLLFMGHFNVVDKIFAINEILMKTTKQINMNLVRDLSIRKSYSEIESGLYLPDRSLYEGNFTVLSKNNDDICAYLKKETINYDYTINNPREYDFYNKINVKTSSNQFEQDDDYWQKSLNLSQHTQQTSKVIEKLKSNKKIKTITSLLSVASTGYVDLFKGLQAGSLWRTISNNDVEGLRFRIGLRTFITEDDKFRLNAYGAYGIKDNKFKYGIEALYLFSSEPRIVIGASHLRDNLQLSGKLLEIDDLLPKNKTSFIMRGKNYYLSNVMRNSINLDWALNENLHFNISGVYQNIQSAAPDSFSINYTYPNTFETQNKLIDASSNITLTYTPGRNVYGYGAEQKIGKLPYSTIALKYTKGYKGILNSDFNYNKIQLSVEKKFFLSNFGILNASIELGKTFNSVPISLLSPIPANQSISVTPKTFSLLNYYNLVTDTYMMGNLEHHFNGFIFNRIPLIRKLNLRSFIFYRFAYGSISKNNIDINRSSIFYVAPENQIYSEYGFGIENIGYGNIRPFRVDFIWRGTIHQVFGITPPNFGVRFGFSPGF